MIWNLCKRLFSPRRDSMAIFGRTDTGRVRGNNEDSFVALPESRLMMVADGMGGHKAGEVASRLAIEAMVRLLSPEALGQAGGNQAAVCHLLIRSLRQMNDKVMAKSSRNEDWAGMGATFVVAYVHRHRLYVSHVGDVRAYLLRGADFRQLTVDHTYVAEGSGGSRHVVSRAVGFPWSEDPDCAVIPVQAGDRILLCSDGLWSMVPDARLASILRQGASPESACDQLVAEANAAGGTDNITAVLGFV